MANENEVIIVDDLRKENIQPYIGQRLRRTRKFAEEHGLPLAKMPDKRYRLTHPDFRYALTPLNNADIQQRSKGQSAYVQLTMVDPLAVSVKDGDFAVNGIPTPASQLVIDENAQHTAKIDMALANSLFSIIWNNIRGDLEEILPYKSDFEWNKFLKNNPDIFVTRKGIFFKVFGLEQRVYIPDFLEYIGLNPANVSEQQIDALIRRMQMMQGFKGRIDVKLGDRVFHEERPFLSVVEEKTTYTFVIQSPYMNLVVERALHDKSFPLMKKGRPQVNKHGEPMFLPPVSTIVHPYLDMLPNRRAAELADVIATLIEVCPNEKIPNIEARKLIKRCNSMDYAFETMDTRSKKNRLMKNAFECAFEYLRDYTYVFETYRNLKMPIVPTMKLIDKNYVMYFQHDGKFREDVIKKAVANKKEKIKNATVSNFRKRKSKD